MADEDTYFILTYWGTIVSADPNKPGFCQTALTDTSNNTKIPFQISGTTLQSRVDALDRFEIYRDADDNLSTLRRDGLYLCAGENGSVRASREEASSWERFLLVSSADLDCLSYLLQHDWIDARTRENYRKNDIAILNDFRFRLGPHTIKLTQNVPLLITEGRWFGSGTDPTSGFNSCTLWVDQWKPIEINVLRPLVFYCVFGESAFSMLATSLRSLRDLAGYQRDLLIITDSSRREVEKYTHNWPESRLHILNVSAIDYLDFCSARYRVVEWSKSHQFQPLLYVDTDVVFDRDPEALFAALVLGSKMSAQREPGAFLVDHDPVGSALFQEAGVQTHDELGFNAGIFGISNIAKHGRLLRTIYAAIYRYADAKKSRNTLSHFDQSMANYICFVTDSSNLDICSNHIRWAHTSRLHGGDHPIGLVHFWGLADKQDEMEAYIDAHVRGVEYRAKGYS